MSQIAGSAEAAECTSFTAQTADSCYGYYCGVSLDIVVAELSPTRKCQLSPEVICEGKLSQKVGSCARDKRTQAPFRGWDEAEIRAETQSCVYEDATLEEMVSQECLDCYLDGAQCAGMNCSLECLGMDSANCDACREENNCNQPVPGCAGLPSPF
jgi:hypothetical protein